MKAEDAVFASFRMTRNQFGGNPTAELMGLFDTLDQAIQSVEEEKSELDRLGTHGVYFYVMRSSFADGCRMAECDENAYVRGLEAKYYDAKNGTCMVDMMFDAICDGIAAG